MSGAECACDCFNITLHLADEPGSAHPHLKRHPAAQVPSLVSLDRDASGLVTAKCLNCAKACFAVRAPQETPLLDVPGFFQRIDLTQTVTLLHVRSLDSYVNLPNYSQAFRILIPPRNVDSSSAELQDMHISVHLQHRLSSAIKMKCDDLNKEITRFMKIKEEELEAWSRSAREDAVILTERENQLNLHHKQQMKKSTLSTSITFSDSAKDPDNAEKNKRSRLRSARTSSPSKGKKKRVSFSANLPRKSSQVDTDDEILSTSSSAASLTCNGGLTISGSYPTASTSMVMEDEAVFDFDEEISNSNDCGTKRISSGIKKIQRRNSSSPPYMLPPSPLQPRTKSKYDLEEFDNETVESTNVVNVDTVPVTLDNIEPRPILSMRGGSSTSELARSLPISIPSQSLPPPVGFSDETENARNTLSTRKQSSKIEVARSFQERMMLEDNIDPTESIYDVPNGNWRSLG